MPFPGSTVFPVASPDDAGVVVDALLKSGVKYMGKRVVLIGDLMPEDERLKIWADSMPHICVTPYGFTDRE